MESKYRVSLINRIFRGLIKPVFRLIFYLISRVKVEGLENIPKKGPYLIVFNHVSLYDPPFLVAYWPDSPEILGAIDVWNRPGQNLLAHFYGGIPIRRGEVDRAAMEGMLAALRSGKPLLIAPEGGRSHTPGMRQAKAGIVYVVERTHVPVLPVGIVGTTDDFIQEAFHWKRPTIAMIVGKPFIVPELEESSIPPRELRQKKADFIMEQVAALLPPEYQGVYTSNASQPVRVLHPIA